LTKKKASPAAFAVLEPLQSTRRFMLWRQTPLNAPPPLINAKVPTTPLSQLARKSKKGLASMGRDMTHVVRVTVLGLADIIVDRSKNKDKNAPAPPSEMRAIVAFSKNSTIKGTTSLSKPLARSPSNGIVMTTESKSRNHKDDDTYQTAGTLDLNCPQRRCHLGFR
jgi:hypothetical protein